MENMEGYLTVTNELLRELPIYPKTYHHTIFFFYDRCWMQLYGKHIHYLYLNV